MSSADLEVSEIFQSLQGEGVSAGVPCSFLRLAVCNLRCSWCDTKYSWDFKNFVYEKEVTRRSVPDVAAELQGLTTRHLVVTGGEPLLQSEALALLLERLPDFTVEIETNGTIAPAAELARLVQQWNVSPKLANSGEPAARRVKLDVLAQFAALPNAWLKLVIANAGCVAEARELADQAQWPRQRILWMPEATTRAQLAARAPEVAKLCVEHGVRFSSRLHLTLFDGKRGT